MRIWGSLSLIVKYANDLKRKGSKFPYREEMIKYLLFLNKHKVLKIRLCTFKVVYTKKKKKSQIGWVLRLTFGEVFSGKKTLTD